MKELVLFLAKQLADHPEQVSVSETERERTLALKLAVAEEDKGRVIGKQGRVIRAIRTLAQTAAGPGKKVLVDLD